MAGSIFSNINPATTSGTQLSTLLNNFKDAVASGFSGTTRPTNLQAGGYWVDTTNAGTPNFYWDVKVYTGTADVTVYRVNLDTNTVSISGAETLFTIEKTSADTSGPILKFLKERIANSGQVLTGDILAELQFFGAASDDSNPVVAKIKCVATDDMTASASGAYLSFEATADGTAALVEMMRLIDGKLGVGLIAPVSIIHARGASGIRSENRADDAVGATVVAKKSRILSSGQVQSADVIGKYQFNSTDEAGADIEVAKLEAKATETHTSTAQGSDLSLYVKANGATAYTEVYNATSSLLDFKVATKQVAVQLDKQDVASAASITQLSATKAIVNITGSTETYIQGINSAGATKVIVIHNSSTANVFINHEDTGATAADRFKLPKAKAIKVIPDSSIELFYEVGATRWKVKSGSGSGGGDPVAISALSLTGGGTITLQDEAVMDVLVQGSTGPVTLSGTPFGAFAPQVNMEINLIGNSDANAVTFIESDVAKVLIGYEFTLGKGQVATLKYNATLDRYVIKSTSN